MQTKQVWGNLSVKDVERTHKFNKKLGFKSNGKFDKENDLASFVVGPDDFMVHFFTEESFKPSLGGPIADLRQGNEVMFTLSADRKKEVEQWATTVKKAGGIVLAQPRR